MPTILQLLLFGCLLQTASSDHKMQWNTLYSFTTDEGRLISILRYTVDNSTRVFRVTLESNDSSVDNFLLVGLRQRNSIIGLHVPRIINNYEYDRVSRTLCPLQDFTGNEPFTIEVASYQPLNYTVRTDVVTDFEFKTNTTRVITASASQPKFFHYVFPDDIHSVTVHVDSNSTACMTVSIQEVGCLVFDLQSNVQYKGLHSTMTTHGTVRVAKSEYKEFYVVFVINENDDLCENWSNIEPMKPMIVPLLEKTFNVTLEEALSPTYLGFIVWTFGMNIGIIFIIVPLLIFCDPKSRTRRENRRHQEYEELLNTEANSSQTVEQIEMTDVGTAQQGSSSEEVTNLEPQTNERTTLIKSNGAETGSANREVLAAAGTAMLSAVLQMVFNQAKNSKQGDSDQCIFNFNCAHPWWVLVAANNVFSNLPYLFVGIVIFGYYYSENPNNRNGVYQHYGLIRTIGLAIASEGFFSASYHVCPSRNNFQFDTFNMYLIAFLLIKLIWSTRHEQLFPILGTHFYCCIITLTGVLDMYGVKFMNYEIFVIVHFGFLLYLLCAFYTQGHPKEIFKTPWSCHRFCFIALILLSNIVVCTLSNVSNLDILTTELFMLIINSALYLGYYLFMKIIKENNVWTPKLIALVLLVPAVWILAIYIFYFEAVSDWRTTPAHSREKNRQCLWAMGGYYDYHDLWHILSAFALFLTVLLVVTIDDNLLDIPRDDVLRLWN